MRAELPAVVRREELRKLRARFAPLAAALLLAATIAVWFSNDRAEPELASSATYEVTARSGSPQRRGVDAPAWGPLGDISRLNPGDTVAVSPGELELRSSRGERLAFSDGRIAVLTDGIRVERGAAEWVTPSDFTGTLATPLLDITATASRVRLRVERLPTGEVPLDRSAWEGSDMNGKQVIGAGLGVALIVTVIVLSTGDEAVEIDREGEKTTLERGDSASVTSGGSTTVTRSGGSGEVATREESTPDRDDIVEGLASVVDTSQREFWVEVLDPAGDPVESATVVVVEGAVPPPATGPTDGTRVVRGETDESGRASVKIPSEWTSWAAVSTAKRLGEQAWNWSEETGLLGSEDSPDGVPAEGESTDGPEIAAKKTATTFPGATEESPWRVTLPYETSILGFVIDAATGEPILGALTALQRDPGPTGWSEPVIQRSEEEDGSFYFGGLRAGTYWVWSVKEGFSRSDRWTVTLADGEQVTGDPIGLAPGVEVQVTVFDKKTGKPVPRAVVYPHLDHLPGTVDFPHRGAAFDTRVRDVARTNAQGVAVLKDLPARSTLLRVLHEGYRIVDLEAEGAPGVLEEFEVALEKGPSIRGEVINAAGEAVNESEIFAVTMTMNREKAEVLAGKIENGRYEIPNVNAGQYVVVYNGVAGDGSDMNMQFSQVVAGKDTVVDFIEVAELATIRGRILDHDGEPLARRFVTVSTIDDLGEVTFRSGTTAADGTFEIKNLPLKEWAVAVSHTPESMVTIGSMNLDQAIDYEEEFSVPSGSLIGSIRAEDGTPDIRVELFIMKVMEEGQLDWRGRSEARPDGHFEFIGLEEGTYRVFAQGLGYRQTSSRDIEVGEGKASIDMTISPGGTVKVIVTDAGGGAAPDIGVRIIAPEGYGANEGLPARTDNNGEYLFPSLGPGEYRVTLHRDGVPIEGVKGFTAKMGETVEVQMTLP